MCVLRGGCPPPLGQRFALPTPFTALVLLPEFFDQHQTQRSLSGFWDPVLINSGNTGGAAGGGGGGAGAGRRQRVPRRRGGCGPPAGGVRPPATTRSCPPTAARLVTNAQGGTVHS